MKSFTKWMTKALPLSLVLLNIFGLCSCKKLIEIDAPIQSVVGAEIYKENSSASTVMAGLYSTLVDGSFVHGTGGLSFLTGLSADELTLDAVNTNLSYELLYENDASITLGNKFWNDIYAYLFRINGAIAGIDASTGITQNVKNQFLGEAKFLRAFCYFNLVNLYGDVPLLTTTDPKTNISASRTPVDVVYNQIIKDLTEAKETINENYVSGNGITIVQERVRPNRAVVSALLAKVYLYTGQWSKAETESSELIANSNYLLSSLSGTFSLDSKETIWALKTTNANQTLDGIVFNLQATENGPSPSRPVYLSTQLVDAFSNSDQRKAQWIRSLTINGKTYYCGNKYKTDITTSQVIEYPVIFRLAEQYLIRAEARAQQNKLNGDNSASADLTSVRVRSGLPSVSYNDKMLLLDAILNERKLELFTEFGNRWFDLKRFNKINDVMSLQAPIKGGSWAPFKALYPIPAVDILNNPSLRGHQNLGYPES